MDLNDSTHGGLAAERALQAAFLEQGPENERNYRLPWWKSEVEPWVTIARKLGVR